MARRGRGEGSIYKTKDGKWVAALTLPTGKRKRYISDTRQEASRKLAAAQRDLEAGLPLALERQTVAHYLRNWLSMIEPTMKERTWDRHEQQVRLHLIPAIGRRQLSALTAQEVQTLYAHLLKKGLASTTVHHVHSTLHKALDRAVSLSLIPRNVTDMVDVPRVDTQEMRPLDAEEARRLLQATADHRLAALYELALNTGMRLGELLGLRWSCVDLDHATLSVKGSLSRSRRQNAWVIEAPKTRRSRRQIALHPSVIEALRHHRAQQREERLFLGPAWEGASWDLVFCTQLGHPIAPTNFYTSFKRVLRAHHLPDIRPHDLRHTCATLALRPCQPQSRLRDVRACLRLHYARSLQPCLARHASRRCSDHRAVVIRLSFITMSE